MGTPWKVSRCMSGRRTPLRGKFRDTELHLHLTARAPEYVGNLGAVRLADHLRDLADQIENMDGTVQNPLPVYPEKDPTAGQDKRLLGVCHVQLGEPDITAEQVGTLVERDLNPYGHNVRTAFCYEEQRWHVRCMTCREVYAAYNGITEPYLKRIGDQHPLDPECNHCHE